MDPFLVRERYRRGEINLLQAMQQLQGIDPRLWPGVTQDIRGFLTVPPVKPPPPPPPAPSPDLPWSFPQVPIWPLTPGRSRSTGLLYSPVPISPAASDYAFVDTDPVTGSSHGYGAGSTGGLWPTYFPGGPVDELPDLTVNDELLGFMGGDPSLNSLGFLGLSESEEGRKQIFGDLLATHFGLGTPIAKSVAASRFNPLSAQFALKTLLNPSVPHNFQTFLSGSPGIFTPGQFRSGFQQLHAGMQPEGRLEGLNLGGVPISEAVRQWTPTLLRGALASQFAPMLRPFAASALDQRIKEIRARKPEADIFNLFAQGGYGF